MGRSELFEILPTTHDPKSIPVKLRVALYTNVKNSPELRNLLNDGKLDCALLDPELILEVFQVLAAANRAVSCEANHKMATKNIHTELLYSLSPTKNISESLRLFGISDDSRNVLLATVGDDNGSKLSAASRKVKGRVQPLTKLQDIANYDLIKKVYHVHEPELNKASILDSVVTRIVSKDYS